MGGGGVHKIWRGTETYKIHDPKSSPSTIYGSSHAVRVAGIGGSMVWCSLEPRPLPFPQRWMPRAGDGLGLVVVCCPYAVSDDQAAMARWTEAEGALDI